MLELPDVTLVMIETQEHDLAREAIMDCMAQAKFGAVLIFTDKPEKFTGVKCALYYPVENWPSKIGWCEHLWYDVPRSVFTSHAMIIQWDSWIIDPEMWDNEYLKYDYIGAPWWYDTYNVGNSGFSLRSKRLMDYLVHHKVRYPVIDANEDQLLSRKYRREIEHEGYSWAPDKLAGKFSFERTRLSYRHFGFHGIFNWPLVLDDKRLAERVAIARQSHYIRNTNMLAQIGAYNER